MQTGALLKAKLDRKDRREVSQAGLGVESVMRVKSRTDRVHEQ